MKKILIVLFIVLASFLTSCNFKKTYDLKDILGYDKEEVVKVTYSIAGQAVMYNADVEATLKEIDITYSRYADNLMVDMIDPICTFYVYNDEEEVIFGYYETHSLYVIRPSGRYYSNEKVDLFSVFPALIDVSKIDMLSDIFPAINELEAGEITDIFMIESFIGVPPSTGDRYYQLPEQEFNQFLKDLKECRLTLNSEIDFHIPPGGYLRTFIIQSQDNSILKFQYSNDYLHYLLKYYFEIDLDKDIPLFTEIGELAEEEKIKICDEYLTVYHSGEEGVTCNIERYYGTYHDMVVVKLVCMNNEDDYIPGTVEVTIGNYVFRYKNNKGLTVYQNGKFYTLKEAYEEGKINNSQLEIIYKQYIFDHSLHLDN